jgi:hypothetical protein
MAQSGTTYTPPVPRRYDTTIAAEQVDRAQIARLQGERNARATHVEDSFAGDFNAGGSPTSTGNGVSSGRTYAGGSGGQSTTSSSCRHMTGCVRVKAEYDKAAGQSSELMHIVVTNTCNTPVRITASVYGQNLGCVFSGTSNFSPGASEDLGQQTDRNWYSVQADDNVTSGQVGSGCPLVVANSCRP